MNGLADNAVLCIEQDHYGLMWFGTENGLNCYDGYNYRIYQHDDQDSASIGANIITCMLEDHEGRLWIGTGGGSLNRYLREKDGFRQYQADAENASRLPFNYITCIFEDNQNKLWIGTSSGMAVYREETDSFIRFPLNQSIKAIQKDSHGRLWVGTAYDGIYCFETDLKTRRHYMHNPGLSAGLSSNRIESILSDPEGRLWIGTIDGGLNLYDPEQDGFYVYLNDPSDSHSLGSNTVYTLYSDHGGAVWAGCENAGLYRIHVRAANGLFKPSFEGNQHDINDARSLSNNTVRSIFEDMQGNLWVGTYYGGINCFRRHKKQFVNYYAEPYNERGLSHDVVQAFLEDHVGRIWIGTDGGGLNLFDRSGRKFIQYRHQAGNANSLCSDHILDICEDHDGTLWLATWDGLSHFYPEKNRFHSIYRSDDDQVSLSSNNVTCVLEDSGYNLWIGTASGLHLLTPDRRTMHHFDQDTISPVNSRFIHSVYQDREKNVWVATVHGLYTLSRQNLEEGHFEFSEYITGEDSASLPESHVITIFEDSRGIIWLGTIRGLCRFDVKRRRFVLFGTNHGLASNHVNAITEDKQGHLWIGTLKGISRFEPEENRFVNYGLHDGLHSDAFTSAVMRSRSGDLFFGSKMGFTCFMPDSIRQSSYVPPVVITDFQIFGRSVPWGDVLSRKHPCFSADSISIELDFNQNMISFEFAALDFTSPEKNLYQYKLDGFDTEWRSADAGRRFATFTNLGAGDYVFRVRGANCDGVWNTRGVSVAMKIHPPFWRSTWALFIYIGLLFSLLMLLRELVVYREKLKNEIIFERNEADRIHELDEMKLRFFTNISHEFRTPLTLIIGLLERLIHSRKNLKHRELHHHFFVMQRNARRLLRLINQIMDIRKLDQGRLQLNLKYRDIVKFVHAIYASFQYQAEQRNIQYQFITRADHFYMRFDPDIIDKILFNILSNAFKFTQNDGSIVIEVDVPFQAIERCEYRPRFVPLTPEMTIRIQDSGIGIEREYLDRIFDPFFQIPAGGDFNAKGTGIGLSLTRELVELHQGKIHVDSEPRRGSCFTLQLPTNLVQDSEDVLDETGDREQPDLVPYPDAVINSQKIPDDRDVPLLLIVDDDLDLCNFLRDELIADHRIMLASNGSHAFEKAVSHLPHLIVSDVRMPEMDGFALCSKLKHHEQTAHIPVILLTSQSNEKNQMNGYDAGADDYVVKPFDIQLLRVRIANLLQSRKALKERFSHEIYLQPGDIVITPEQERFLVHILDVIEAHMEDPDYSVSQLGKDIGLSRVQLYRKVKTISRMNPNELIRDLRLKRAAKLLETSHLTVFEIAYRVGFKDPSYFCKCFKQQFHVSPSEYARVNESGRKPEQAL
ncbi:response regulator [bacterium]|nr:response regulator [bacterium]